MRAWGITDGSVGAIAQVRALALALDATLESKNIVLKKHFAWQPNAMYAAGFQHLILGYALNKTRSDALAPPWPDLVISCGRKGALVAMGLQSSLRGGQHPTKQSSFLDRHGSSSLAMTKFVHIGDPYVAPKYFDVVIAMGHDKISGDNVIKTRFALHRITQGSLSEARGHFETQFSAYPRPHVAVLVGGSTNKYTLKPAAIHGVIVQLENVLESGKGSLLVTPSRRTGEENTQLLRSFATYNHQRIYVYDGKAENPYMGLLALADTIFVTNDSVNMMSEAVATGKPIYILPLAGHKNTKPARFAEGLIHEGIARVWQGKLEQWSYPVIDEMGTLRQMLSALL